MNKKILSHDELVKRLKEYEDLQRHNKNIRDTHCHWSVRAKFQKYVKETKDEINMLLTALYHAKEARNLYEYKRRYTSLKDSNMHGDYFFEESIRGLCTENYLEPEE